ncbi:IS3 family transposase [Streptomyces sp. NBC_00825]|uniref:IS3 family transposase n=1 Tax=unclassified Streptomyces TaxID=2593676 RepID=UPI002ED000F1|nr:IS3 family transposase [Streptomyces sp. NBC_00826]WTH89113.1 IS3 family transposase [Streptomyces sp. NBC_00825]WTH97841.1 IS3 family transposase [Streptomyces sp. NBC_00822]
MLEVSRSGYYWWIAGAEARAARQADKDALVDEIREIHAEHRVNYGALRVHAELRGFGHTVNRKRVARLMRKHDIVGCHLRKKKRTTIPDRLAPPAPDLVRRDFTAADLRPNGVATSHTCRSERRGSTSPVVNNARLTYCNARRRHSGLSYLSPMEFEQQHHKTAKPSLAA